MADPLQQCANCGKSQADLGTTLLRCSRCKLATYCSKDCQSIAWVTHKSACTPWVPSFSGPPSTPASGRKTVILLELEDYSWLGDLYDDFHAEMSTASEYHKVVNIGSAVDQVATNPNAVVLFEPSIMNEKKPVKYQVLNQTLVAYAKAGGIVVFGLQQQRRYFNTVWDMPWKFGNYARFDFEPNSEIRHINGKTLPTQYNVKAVQLDNVGQSAVVYWQAGESYSMASLPTPEDHGKSSGSVVWQKYGEGWVAWLGDVNNETETMEITRIMCGI